MATIRVKILSTIYSTRTADNETYHVLGITADSLITRIHFNDSLFVTKLDIGGYVDITACRVTPREEVVHVNLQDGSFSYARSSQAYRNGA